MTVTVTMMALCRTRISTYEPHGKMFFTTIQPHSRSSHPSTDHRLCMSGCNLPPSCSLLRVNRTSKSSTRHLTVAFSTNIAPQRRMSREQPNFASTRGLFSCWLRTSLLQNDSSPCSRSLAGACSSSAPCVPIHLSFAGRLRLGHLWPRNAICTCVARSVGRSTTSGPPSDDCISSGLDFD